MERKMLISSGKLHMKNECIFSSFNMIYLSSLFCLSIFFPLLVKACNPILLSGSRYFTCAASSSCFPSAVYKGGLRLSACWTVILPFSRWWGCRDLVCRLWSSFFARLVNVGVHQERMDWAEWEPGSCACASGPPVSAQLHLTPEDLGSN